MNQRIQELIRQSTVPANQAEEYAESKGLIEPSEKLDVAKFAELIVRECMQLNRDILCEDDPDYLDQVYKEHFGVEE